MDDLVEASAYLRELIGEPGEDRDRTEGDEAEVELPAKLVGCGVGDAAQNGVAVHLGEDPDEAQSQQGQEDGEAPVDEGVRLEGVGVPGDQGEDEGGGDEEHQIANIDEHGADEGDVADDEELLG